MNKTVIAPTLSLVVTLSGVSVADTLDVDLPENYASRFVRYASVDKPAGERPAKMRFFYVDPAILAAARVDEPLPSGTVLIMEDRGIELDASGEPVLDVTGRFVPTDEITNLFVQEKRDGWGEDHPKEVRNGEWEYAWFLPDGSRKADASMDGCFGCHAGAADTDYNFTFSAFVATMK